MMNSKCWSHLPWTALAGLGVWAGTLAPASAQSVVVPIQSTAPSGASIAQVTSIENLMEVAADDEELDTLVSAVETAGLEDTLADEGPFTLFAPTDTAFDNLPDGALDALLMPENRDLLTDILTYHVIPGEVLSDDLETGGLDTLNGGLAVRVDPDRVVVNDASVVAPDIVASNGVIHRINRVLIPSDTRAELESRMQAMRATSAEPVRALW